MANIFREYGGMLIVLVALCIISSIMSQHFFTVYNIFNVLRQASTTILISTGMAILLISGGIDLSVGAVVGLAGSLQVVLLNQGLPFWLVVPLILAMGVVCGFINGIVSSRTTIPAFVFTLATMNVYRGFAYVVTGGPGVRGPTEGPYHTLGMGYVGVVPVVVVITACILVVAIIFMTRTKISRHFYASGGNPEAATYAGIKVKNIKLTAYIICSFLASIVGLIYAARMNSGQPSIGVGWEANAIAAAVLGGVAFTGGRGTIGGTVVGALVLTVINNILDLLQIQSFIQTIISGIIIGLAVYIDYLRRRKIEV